MSTKLTVVVVLFFIILAAGIALIAIPAPKVQAPTTTDGDQTPATSTTSTPLSDLIIVDSPKSGDTISSTTLVATGKARGTWYFEASFPVELRDSTGKVIAQKPAQAEGEWMTTEFVPFSVTFTFPKQTAGSSGTLILKKDNPSGDPARDQQLEIPVLFK